MNRILSNERPAFPSGERYTTGEGVLKQECTKGPLFPGMTIREWFAGQAMSGIFSSRDVLAGCHENARETGRELEETVAILAVKLADALIAELGRES